MISSKHISHIAQCCCLPPQVCCCFTASPVLYYTVMTPQWLQDHANLSQLNAATPESLHFKVNQFGARLIQVPLFQSGELPPSDTLKMSGITATATVEITHLCMLAIYWIKCTFLSV